MNTAIENYSGVTPFAARSSIRPEESYRPAAFGTDSRLQQLMDECPLTGPGRFGCYCIADSSPYSDVARAVECAVFQEFFGNEPSIMTQAYARYEAHSMFLLVVDRELRQAAGTLRIIAHSESGLKTLNDIEEAPLSIPITTAMECHGIDLRKCWDVGTLAVLKQYRGQATDQLVSMMLYGQFYTEVCKAGIEHVVTILDKHAYRQLTETLGMPFVPIAGSQPFNYLGSENSRAAYMHIPSAFPAVVEYMNKLDKGARHQLKSNLARVLFGEGQPKAVAVA